MLFRRRGSTPALCATQSEPRRTSERCSIGDGRCHLRNCLRATYATIGGAAPVVLLVRRILQGAALGGEFPGAWTFVAEQVAAPRVGFACSVLSSALSIGNLLGALAGLM
jgi:MFS family permease